MDYLQPDNIWNHFGVKSDEDFLEQYVLRGKFHSKVPEKIVEDYKIVERLLFYSYFHYPLIDEAFSKSTRIFEAAVTLKLENLGLKKDGFEGLNSKLNRLKEYCSEELFEQWKGAKELRNSFAHREAGSFGGIALLNGFKYNLNMINSLFLETKTIKEKENLLSNLLQQSDHLIKGLFILEYKSSRILIYGTRPYAVGIMKNRDQSLWVFIPISGDKIIEKSFDLPSSFILKLENVQINEVGLSANDPNTKEPINLTLTDKSENVEKLKQHNSRLIALERTSPEISFEYMSALNHSIGKEISHFLYEDW